MTPDEDNFDITIRRVAEIVKDLRALAVPAHHVQSISVDHWHTGVAVNIHINGATVETVEIVDRIADHYGLPGDTHPDSGNYGRGEHLGVSPVHVFCGRPEVKGS